MCWMKLLQQQQQQQKNGEKKAVIFFIGVRNSIKKSRSYVNGVSTVRTAIRRPFRVDVNTIFVVLWSKTLKSVNAIRYDYFDGITCSSFNSTYIHTHTHAYNQSHSLTDTSMIIISTVKYLWNKCWTFSFFSYDGSIWSAKKAHTPRNNNKISSNTKKEDSVKRHQLRVVEA